MLEWSLHLSRIWQVLVDNCNVKISCYQGSAGGKPNRRWLVPGDKRLQWGNWNGLARRVLGDIRQGGTSGLGYGEYFLWLWLLEAHDCLYVWWVTVLIKNATLLRDRVRDRARDRANIRQLDLNIHGVNKYSACSADYWEMAGKYPWKLVKMLWWKTSYTGDMTYGLL